MRLIVSLLFTLLLPSIPYANTPVMHAVTFEIINDDQFVVIEVEEGDFIFSPPTMEARPNVRLNGWYKDEALTQRVDFDVAIVATQTFYAEWTYMISSFNPAQIRLSGEGNRFESGTMTMFFDLYEPLTNNVMYQWQTSEEERGEYKNIAGANQSSFTPYVNGNKYYRLMYTVINPDPESILDLQIPYYTNSVYITIYGQSSLNLVFILLIILIMITALTYFMWKRKIFFETFEGDPLPPMKFKVGEDASLLPKAVQKGYTFQGWYTDASFQEVYLGIRMPMKSFTLYAKFKKRKNL
jgi:uncharacterized repeat protein (TIGR02543 family)